MRTSLYFPAFRAQIFALARTPTRKSGQEFPTFLLVFALAAVLYFFSGAPAHTLADNILPAPKKIILRMQSAWPANSTFQDSFKQFADRVQKLSNDELIIDTLAAGQVVPPFELLEATSKRVIDGAHAWPGYWVGKNRAAILFAGPPGGPFGMDSFDFLGWMYHGGGSTLIEEFYQDILQKNVVSMPSLPFSPQPLGWFKEPIENLDSLRGRKCRFTGLSAEVWSRLGVATINMPGGEIIPAAQRGVIDCADWAGGVEDLRLGFHNVWKYYYTPGILESSVVGELLINSEVWESLSPGLREIMRSAAQEMVLYWWTAWQGQNALALEELRDKHGVVVKRTPPEILTTLLKTWDTIAAEEQSINPFFKKVWESQRQYARLIVPAKRLHTPPYSFAAQYYWPLDQVVSK